MRAVQQYVAVAVVLVSLGRRLHCWSEKKWLGNDSDSASVHRVEEGPAAVPAVACPAANSHLLAKTFQNPS